MSGVDARDAPVLLFCQGVHVALHLADMAVDCGRPSFVIVRLEGFHERRQRHLGIENHRPVLRQMDDHVGSNPFPFAVEAVLHREIDVLPKARKLKDPLKLGLPPPAAHVGPLKRVGKRLGLAGEFPVGLHEVRYLSLKFACILGPCLVQRLDFLRQGLDQFLDGFLARFKCFLGVCLERFLLRLKDFRRQGLEGVLEPLLHLVPFAEAFLRVGEFLKQFGPFDFQLPDFLQRLSRFGQLLAHHAQFGLHGRLLAAERVDPAAVSEAPDQHAGRQSQACQERDEQYDRQCVHVG